MYKGSIDWPNHIVGFIIVVGGILMAFSLERCATERREANSVDRHLQEILEETRFNRNNLRELIASAEANSARLDTMLQVIGSSEDIGELQRRMFGLLNVHSAYLKRNAYELFVQTGDVRFVESFELKSDMIVLYEYCTWVETQNTLMLQTYKERFFDYIVENLNLSTIGPRATLADYRSREFINGVSSYRYFIGSCLRVYREALERMDEFLESYEQEFPT